ncbi:hypothetical protein [Methylocystis iwaonis]|uniref:Uncharacterized protein n=1 Tax=Methylocystis iwaonis TaxID=2885079 RepID=A0ABM8E9D6_9HYPH|nr:hypothetical protein [Methylocystis iwaonis]BDV34586.1 hypothetical protein SS37A_21150 [Methylocystis iwaonis]
MRKNFDSAAERRAAEDAPSIVRVSLRRPAETRSRAIFLDAAVCFMAAVVGSLAPQALNLLDLAPDKPVVANVDPESGKFIDRILVGGLQPLSWDDRKTPPPPAFLSAPALPAAVAETIEDAPRKVVAAVSKPVKEAQSVKKAERAPEKAAEAAPTTPVRVAAVDASAPNAKPEPVEEGLFAALTPSSVSTKLAPVGQRMWSGARSLGGSVVAGGLSWLGY